LKVWNDFIWDTLETIIWWLNPPQNTLNLNDVKLGEWKVGRGGEWEMKILKEQNGIWGGDGSSEIEF